MNIDTFEALKGNVKILDLDLAIDRVFQQAKEYTDRYRTEEDKIRWQTLKESAWGEPNFQSCMSEPPPGQRRAYNQRVKQFETKLYKLNETRRQILNLTYDDHNDDEDLYEYQVEVTVRRKLKDTAK